MQCPFCDHPESKVTDSRPTPTGGIKRRRECERCGLRFTTFEHVERPMPAVVKRSGAQEPFDRDKLLRTLLRVARGRPIAGGAASQLVDLTREVEVELSTIKDRVPSLRIAELLVQRLEQLDRLTWERFASHYRREDGASLFEPERTGPRSRQLQMFAPAAPAVGTPAPAPAEPRGRKASRGS